MDYIGLRQNQALNCLAHFSTCRYEKDGKLTQKVINTTYGKCKFTIALDNDDIRHNAFTQKLYRFICGCYTEKGCNELVCNVRVTDVLEGLGLTDVSENRKLLSKNLENLKGTKLLYSIQKHRGEVKNAQFKLIEEFRIKNGILNLRVSVDMLKALSSMHYTKYPKELLKISCRCKFAFALLDKIEEQHRNNKNKGDFSVSIGTLYKVCRNCGLPTPKEVRSSGNKSYKEKILKPFERVLCSCKLFEWKYRYSTSHSKFESWLNDYIEFSFLGGDVM